MKKKLFNKNALVISILAFFIVACSHAPTKSDLANITNTSKIVFTTTTQKPDLIIPPASNLLNHNITKNNTKDRLIWEHISDSLELTKFYSHPHVIKQQEKYLAESEYLSIVSKRSEPFIHFVLTEVKKRKMPAELAILPIVESGYYPRARSRAKAEGLWQIMPYTGKELGLKHTYQYDGRHDVYAATSAALDYLEQMHRRFDGDWLLALAAYNAGPHRVKRALQHSIHSKNENSYWDLHLPRETRQYIPKILALSAIVQNEEFSDTLLYPIADKPYLQTIQLSKRISPAKLVHATDVSESEIKLLNPALRNLNTPIHAGYHLLVPKHDAEFLSLAIEKMPEDTQPVLAKHIINRGESLSTIAHRYGTSVIALREANNLYSNTIVAGHSLFVPSTSDAEIIKSSNKPKQPKSPIQRSANNTNKSIAEPYMYVVAMGDSFWKIAHRNNTTVQRLYKINGRNGDEPLLPGETILVD